MKASRNDPCPCGSGKKYKACCMRADQDAGLTVLVLGPQAAARVERTAADAARGAPAWQADVAPLMGLFPETQAPGAVAVVTAAGFVLHVEVISTRPVGAEERARVVLNAVMSAARKAGELPERLHVRDAVLADALGPELQARGVTPVRAPLSELDEALDEALNHLAEDAAQGAAYQPWTWGETEASPVQLAEFHAATAAYHRAQPWKRLSDTDALLLTYPGEDDPWAASVMGWGGIHYGLALYSDPSDLDAMMRNDGDDRAGKFVAVMQGITLSLSYDSARELSRPMRREVALAGWELAGPSAYPTLLALNVPGRRLTPDLVRRTALAASAIAAFTRLDAPAVPWTDPASGVEVDYMFCDDDDDDDDGLPWPRLEVSHLVGPAGPRADLQAAMDADNKALALRETRRYAGFSSWLQGQKPSQAARDRLMRTAAMWTRFLAGYGVPAESVTEYDVRLFLYQYIGRFENPSKPVGRHLTRSLARIFDFHAEHEGIEYPWAGFVLDELDELLAGADDPREVLREVGPHLAVDLLVRGLRPAAEVAGTVSGWSVVADNETGELREELQRRWLMWHDEVVRTGITDPGEVRDVLLGRQRQWENTPHARWAGQTPKQVLIESCRATGG
jgi:hypothetical protein